MSFGDLRLVRRALAPLLAVLSLASAVASPLVEAADAGHAAVLESRHDRTACAHGHDHGICTQVAANAGVATQAGRYGLVARTSRAASPRTGRASPPRREQSLPLGSRAPPLA